MSVSDYLKCFAKLVGYNNPLRCRICNKDDKVKTKELIMGAGAIYHCSRCNIDFYLKNGNFYYKECSPFGMYCVSE